MDYIPGPGAAVRDNGLSKGVDADKDERRMFSPGGDMKLEPLLRKASAGPSAHRSTERPVDRRATQSVRQKHPKKPASSGGKKKRKRLERLMVLYGPNTSFQKRLLDKVSEKYDENFHLPPIVTTMPPNHQHISENVAGHRLIHVETADFESMVSSAELVCYFHVFETASPLDMRPATLGQCTAASATDDVRKAALVSAGGPMSGVTKTLSTVELHSTTWEDENKVPAGSEAFCAPNGAGRMAVSDPPSLAGPLAVNDQLTPAAAEQLVCRRNMGQRLAHPPLAERSSAPGGLDYVSSMTSLRHTFYFGFTERALREAFQEGAGSVVTLLLPQVAASRVLPWCSGRFPNAFLACYERSGSEHLIRMEHPVFSDASDESIAYLHELSQMVLTAPRFDKISYAEALAYFQSRQFLLERKEAAGSSCDKKEALNVSKIRLDRALKPERDLVVTVAGCKYNPEDPLHLRVSRTVYNNLTKLGGGCPAGGRHWVSIGCNEDGSPAVECGGMMSYMHLLHLVATDGLQSLVSDIFQLSEGGKRFKFIEVTAKISKSVLLSLHTSYMQKLCNQRQQIFGVLNDLYVGALLKFFEVFQCAISPPDVNAILSDIDIDIKQHSRRLMLSVDSHFQGFSFHAQVMSTTVMRTTSLTNFSATRVQVADPETPDSGTPGSQALSTNSSATKISMAMFYGGRSCPAVPQGSYDKAVPSKSLSTMKFLGSSPNVFSTQ